jgi:hypothetical protein
MDDVLSVIQTYYNVAPLSSWSRNGRHGLLSSNGQLILSLASHFQGNCQIWVYLHSFLAAHLDRPPSGLANVSGRLLSA